MARERTQLNTDSTVRVVGTRYGEVDTAYEQQYYRDETTPSDTQAPGLHCQACEEL